MIPEQGYMFIKKNVDAMQVIQIGITLSDGDGNTPKQSTWQFNFKFCLTKEKYNP